MANKTLDNVKAGLKGIRGAGDAIRGSAMEATDQAFDSQPNHPETRGSATKNHAIAEKGQQDLRHADEMLARHKQTNKTAAETPGAGPRRQPLPNGRPAVPVAQNYDEAPPGQPGPDFSSAAAAPSGALSNNKKPAFTRGPSVMDGTAVTSAAPTPAGEIPNPMAYNSAATAQRQRESHLPDLDVRDADVYGSGTFSGEEPVGEIAGTDEFGPELSREETVRPRRGTMTQWEG